MYGSQILTGVVSKLSQPTVLPAVVSAHLPTALKGIVAKTPLWGTATVLLLGVYLARRVVQNLSK